jgi:hypothetical protein
MVVAHLVLGNLKRKGPEAAALRSGHGVRFYFHWESDQLHRRHHCFPDCMLPVPGRFTIGLKYN